MTTIPLPGSPPQRQQLLQRREIHGLPWLNWEEAGRVASPENELGAWWETKRSFEPNEFANQIWVKTCTQGYVTELHFHEDGSLDEYTLFDRVHVPGHWRISDRGSLEIVLQTSQSVYTIEAIASRAGSVHGAVEFEEGQVHAYLKLMRLVPTA